MGRFSTVVAALLLTVASAATALAGSANVSFDSAFAIQTQSYGGGSVIYTSGTSNFLRATAHGDTLQTMPVLLPLSTREGIITSSWVQYGGANGGRVNWTQKGTFSRTLSGGVSVAVGAIYQHVIRFELVDLSQSKTLGWWTYVGDTIYCGGLVYPVGLGGCNDATSDTFGSSVSLTLASSSVRTGDHLALRVRAFASIAAEGFAIGLDAKTQASGLSGWISW